MDGGQDLVVRHGDWRFDAATSTYEIPVAISFNGNLVRTNNYRVEGILTVGENGEHPEFARTWANRTFLDYEDTMRALMFTAAGLLVLNEMSNASESQRR